MNQPISGISSMATKGLLGELTLAFESLSGRKVLIESVGGVDAAKRVQAGEPFDIVVLSRDAIDKLLASSHLIAGSQVDLAHSPVGIAVRGGTAKPLISSEADLREAVLSAPSIGISTGPSGTKLTQLFERWGITSTLRGRIVTPPPGIPVGTLVASGEVSLGFQQMSELMHLQGIELLGPLPAEVQIISTFTAAIGMHGAQPEAARTLLTFLTSPQTDAAKRRHGMESPKQDGSTIASAFHGGIEL